MNESSTMNTQQQITLTPEADGGAGRMFTQDEVNKIVSDRLARERERLADNNEYRALYEAAKQELESLKSENLHRQKTDVYRALLEKANINPKRFPIVLRASSAEIDALELDEYGAAKDAEKLVDAIKKEWADFVLITETTGAQISRPPYSPYYSGEGDQIADAFKPKI